MHLLTECTIYTWSSDYINNRDITILFRGYFIINEILYRNHDAINYLSSEIMNKSYKDVIKQLNGLFSLIIETNDEIIFAVDRVRGLPLFYAIDNNKLYISDTPYKLGDVFKELIWDDVSMEELQKTYLFVGGRETLFKQIKQIQAGEMCIFNKNSSDLNSFDYFTVYHCNFITDVNILSSLFKEAYDKTAENLIRALDGRTAVIPLSGGADSRMIASMLKNKGYNNVICYTYGKLGNRESKISQEVAKKFGYRWTMVGYTNKMWRDLHNDEQYNKYKMKAGSYVSTPHIQDYLAVKILKENGEIPENSVFIPGHSGDMIAGSHITKEFITDKMSESDFYDTIIEKFYRRHKISDKLMVRIKERFNIKKNSNNEDYASYSEWYNLRERQSKFIINSVRVYEHFGYEWLVPLWDNNLFDFWRVVPIEQRYQRKLYFTCVNDKMQSTNDVTVYKSVASRVRNIAIFRKITRRIDRIVKYFNSKFGNESEYKFYEYLRAYFKSDDYFCMEQIYLQEYIEALNKTHDNIKVDINNAN